MANAQEIIRQSNQRIKDLERDLVEENAKKRHACMHNPICHAHLVPIKQAKGLSSDKRSRYGDTVYVCSECGEIIDFTDYSKEDIRNMMFAARSALNQIQVAVGAKLDDNEKEEMSMAFTSLEYLDRVLSNFYLDMIRELKENRPGNGKKQKTQKGGIGLTASMMQ